MLLAFVTGRPLILIPVAFTQLQLTNCVRERPHIWTFHKINNFSTKMNDSFQEVHIYRRNSRWSHYWRLTYFRVIFTVVVYEKVLDRNFNKIFLFINISVPFSLIFYITRTANIWLFYQTYSRGLGFIHLTFTQNTENHTINQFLTEILIKYFFLLTYLFRFHWYFYVIIAFFFVLIAKSVILV
jgi:hypothetical protein